MKKINYYLFFILLAANIVAQNKPQMTVQTKSGTTPATTTFDLENIVDITFTSSSKNGDVLITKGTWGTQTDIYSMLSDGTNQSLIYASSKQTENCKWSDDKTKILFNTSASTTNKPEIFSVNSDGSGVLQLTATNPMYGNGGATFRSNTKIWYVNSQTTGVSEIIEINHDGSNTTQITNFQSRGKQTDPWYSYNSSKTKILYRLQNNSWSPSGELYISNIDFSNEVQLTSNGSNDAWPSFSPDEQKILYSYEEGGLNGILNIYVMDINGNNPMKTTNLTGSQDAMFPLWSPDGTEIMFTLYDGTQFDIYKMNADGTNQINLTNTSNVDEIAWAWK